MLHRFFILPGLRIAVTPAPWCAYALIAALDWYVVFALDPWWPLGLFDAAGAGLFTAWCLGPAMLWAHGKHPRQLAWRRGGGELEG